MLILQNQCNVRLPKYKESSTNIEFDHWKCIRIYQKAHMILKKYIYPASYSKLFLDVLMKK